jgi:hypothetical protein
MSRQLQRIRDGSLRYRKAQDRHQNWQHKPDNESFHNKMKNVSITIYAIFKRFANLTIIGNLCKNILKTTSTNCDLV